MFSPGMLKGSGVKYLRLHMDYKFPIEANFDKLMLYLKTKLISWSNKKVSLVSCVLDVNQIFLSSNGSLHPIGIPMLK
jgi:hypothetical protein